MSHEKSEIAESSSSSSGEAAVVGGPLNNAYFADSKRTLKEDFTVEAMLGDGAFSVVHRARRKSDNEEVAIKIIKKKKVSQVDLQREVDIWRRASNSSSRVVHLYEIYEDKKNVYLVMELMVGGELFEKIANMTDYSEPYAAKIMKQVFLIIRDLHKVDIIHQDLKPENLLLMGKDSMILKLCDFGLAEIADDDIELFGCVGSTTYMAPEVTNESGHHKPVDVYAAGVIMYIMLCGYPPFEPENGIVDLEFPEREWDEISDAAKDMITLLLDEDPMRRPTPEEVLRHRWFMDVETIRNPPKLSNATRTLKNFTEIGPNGTRKEYTSGNKRPAVKGLFDAPPTVPPPKPPVLGGSEITKNSGGSHRGTNGTTKKPVTSSSSKRVTTVPQLPQISSTPQIPSSAASPKKKSARNDNEKKQPNSDNMLKEKENSKISGDKPKKSKKMIKRSMCLPPLLAF